MTDDETISEQLVEIERQAEDTPATEYTPPEGWRVVRFGELLLPGDEWVNWEGTVSRPDILHGDGTIASGGRYIRRIKQEPQPQPVQVREGRWRKRSGVEVSVSAMPTDHDDFTEAFPWWDGHETTWTQSGHLLSSGECAADLVEYLGPIEPEPQQVNDWPSVRDLRHELKTVQTQLGESRQRVTQLEELVTSLRTINEGAERAVSGAGVVNDSLRLQLAAVKAELASVAADRQRLQIELDAAQQVPPAIVDRFKEGWNQGTARAVEAIAEWLQPIRLVDHPNLANETLQHLPQIMRHLTGLNDEEIE